MYSTTYNTRSLEIRPSTNNQTQSPALTGQEDGKRLSLWANAWDASANAEKMRQQSAGRKQVEAMQVSNWEDEDENDGRQDNGNLTNLDASGEAMCWLDGYYTVKGGRILRSLNLASQDVPDRAHYESRPYDYSKGDATKEGQNVFAFFGHELANAEQGTHTFSTQLRKGQANSYSRVRLAFGHHSRPSVTFFVTVDNDNGIEVAVDIPCKEVEQGAQLPKLARGFDCLEYLSPMKLVHDGKDLGDDDPLLPWPAKYRERLRDAFNALAPVKKRQEQERTVTKRKADQTKATITNPFSGRETVMLGGNTNKSPALPPHPQYDPMDNVHLLRFDVSGAWSVNLDLAVVNEITMQKLPDVDDSHDANAGDQTYPPETVRNIRFLRHIIKNVKSGSPVSMSLYWTFPGIALHTDRRDKYIDGALKHFLNAAKGPSRSS